MQKLAIAIAIAVLFALSIPTTSEAKVRLGLGTQLTYAISADTGQGLPAGMIHGLNVLAPLGDGFSLFTEVGFATGLSQFQPCPQVGIGPVWKVPNAPVLLGLAALYRYTPNFEGGAPTDHHMIGGMLLPAYPISEHITVVTPVGVVRNITMEKTAVMIGLRLNISWEL